MSATTWITLLLALPAYGQPATLSIQGRAVDDIDMRPMERARLVLSGAKLDAPMVASVNDRGSFLFSGLAPGVYQLTGEKGGYFPLPPQEVKLDNQNFDAGEVVFTAKRIMSGTVRWMDGEPAAGARVYPLQVTNGTTILPDESQMTATDERGQFRISGLLPGRYVVYTFASSGGRTGMAQPVFYPGGDAPDLARPLDLRGVAETRNIALVLELKKGVEVTGKIGVSASFKPHTDVYLELLLPGNPREVAHAKTQMGEPFQFTGVAPGSYLLVSSAGDPFAGMPRAIQPLVVGAEPVRDLVVAMPEPGPIRGKVEILTADGKRLPAPGVTVIGERDRLGFYGFARGVTNERGEFQMPTAIPGETYTLRVQAPPPRTYPAGPEKLSVMAGHGDASILLRMDGGRIAGKLKSASPTRSVVLLIPKGRNANQWMNSTNPLSNGSFSFDAIAPGDYDLVALDGRYAGDLPSEDVLRKAGRVAVTVRHNETLSIDLQLIRLSPVIQ